MRTRSKSQFNGQWLELIEPEIVEFISRWPHKIIIPRQAVRDLVLYSVSPEAWFRQELVEVNAKNWAVIYRQSPDFTLAFMRFVRGLLREKQNTKRGRIQTWMLTNIDLNGRYQMDCTATEIGDAIGRTVSGEDVRNADKQLRDRLKARRAKFFVSKIQLSALFPADRKRFSEFLPPVLT